MIALTWLGRRARRCPMCRWSPGPTFDTLGQDDRQGRHRQSRARRRPSPPGQLRFVTVGVQSQLTLLQALIGWWRDDDAVVPRELIYPPDETEQQVEQHNAEDFANSQSAAETAALSRARLPDQGHGQGGRQDGSPADGKLQAGDVIMAVDGAEDRLGRALVELIRAKPAGTALTFGVTRDGTPARSTLTVGRRQDGTPRVGFTPRAHADGAVHARRSRSRTSAGRRPG